MSCAPAWRDTILLNAKRCERCWLAFRRRMSEPKRPRKQLNSKSCWVHAWCFVVPLVGLRPNACKTRRLEGQSHPACTNHASNIFHNHVSPSRTIFTTIVHNSPVLARSTSFDHWMRYMAHSSGQVVRKAIRKICNNNPFHNASQEAFAVRCEPGSDERDAFSRATAKCPTT